MPAYRVNHNYRAAHHGPWVKGDTVELTEADAEWVNRDSEGALSLVVEKPAKPEMPPRPAENRQHASTHHRR